MQNSFSQVDYQKITTLQRDLGQNLISLVDAISNFSLNTHVSEYTNQLIIDIITTITAIRNLQTHFENILKKEPVSTSHSPNDTLAIYTRTTPVRTQTNVPQLYTLPHTDTATTSHGTLSSCNRLSLLAEVASNNALPNIPFDPEEYNP